MKPYVLFCFFWLTIGSGTGISQHVRHLGPVVSIDMEQTDEINSQYHLYGKDSIVEGISGKAKYFANNSGVSSYIEINKQDDLTILWKERDFSVEIWVQTKADHDQFEVIASNKDWISGDIKDFTTNHEFGFSRTSGVNKGWAIVCQPDGSWAWNIGSGEYRLDYRPTAPRQKINDGEWHQIVFSINREAKEARMYFDGVNVAIYNIEGIEDMNGQLPVCLANDPLANNLAQSFDGALDEFNLYDYVLDAETIAGKYQEFVPAARFPRSNKQEVKELNLMAWNIWHGGRRHGREIGPKQVIDFIKDTGTDIVMMQETYGSGALIADALGYYFYLASTNISVISKYPILDTKPVYDAFRCGFTTIELYPGKKINLASLWIHYLPGWRSDVRADDATAEKLIEGEGKTRHKEIKEILKRLDSQIQNADQIPMIIGGDFNSPSHYDWTAQTKKWHNGLEVEWPVSIEMKNKGFTDSFREIRSDLNYVSPTMTAERTTYRIDYIYYKGKSLKATESDIHYKYKGIWPSDHPAITTTIRID